MGKNRLEAFSDGVFAIAATLLVLSIGDGDIGRVGAAAALLGLLPALMTYVLSFLIIGVYWVAHHTMMHYVRTVDRNALWINNLTLLAIALMPLPARFISQYPGSPAAVFLYGLTLSAANLTGSWFWWYVTRGRRHVDPALSDAFVKRVLALHVSPVGVYALAFCVSLFSGIASFVIIGLVPAFFILPNPILKRLLSDSRQ